MAQKKKSLPRGWVYVEVRNMKIARYEDKKPILEDIGLKKTITLPLEKVKDLNSQKENTRLFYKVVDNAPEDAPTAEELANVAKVQFAKDREELKAEIKAELEAEAKK